MTFQLVPEQTLILLASLASSHSQHYAHLLEILSGNLDWDYIHQQAYRHRIGCQIFHSLTHIAPQSIPSSFHRFWHEATIANVRTNLFLSTELASIVGYLERHNIDCLIFKGPALAMMLHATLARRPFADIDLVVKNSEAARHAKNLLADLGYRLQKPLLPNQERHLLQTHCEYQLVHPERQILVDLHWKIFYDYFSFDFDLEDAFEHAVPVSIGQHVFQTFRPEDTLLLLCAHHARHAWETLLMLIDIADLLYTHPKLDWEAIMAKADHIGARRFLNLALFLAEQYCKSPIPKSLTRQASSDPVVRRLAHQIVSRWFAPNAEPLNPVDEFVFHIRCRERFYHKIRFFLLGLFTPTVNDFTQHRLPNSWYLLYRVLRPIRLFIRLFEPSPVKDDQL